MDQFTVTPTTMTYGGDALGRLPDGRALFVPFVLPGETVRVQIVEDKQRYARGELIEVLEPSPERTGPRCVHFATCGGCHYQHMPYEIQLSTKTSILRDQLERIGKFDAVPMLTAIGSPQHFNYRNHVQFHLAEGGQPGYFRADKQGVFPIEECHLPEETINRLWPQLDFEFIPDLERIALRAGADDDIQLILESSQVQAPSLLVEELPVSVAHISLAGTLVLAGSEHLSIEVKDQPLRVSAGSFFQVNTAGASLLVDKMLEELGDLGALDGSKIICDAYCGVGLFSWFVAPEVKKLLAIETSASACEDFVHNLDDFDHVELYQADTALALEGIQDSLDVLLLDPPRSGLSRQVIDAITRKDIPILLYISCDPATLARDGKRLALGGYHLQRVVPVDMFPQTFHIESLSIWLR